MFKIINKNRILLLWEKEQLRVRDALISTKRKVNNNFDLYYIE